MFKNKKRQTLAALALLAVAGTASAAIPPEAQAALDSISGLADSVVAWAWGVGTAVVVGFVGLKLTKKAANKAT
ncbi:hypothetical protein FNO25_001327 [Vibrio fluvialis]|uniref:major coat protein n=1 Tax=Vibrio fluvialis TaxID=676 RepID=UPI001F2E8F69|nr:major coat protein [Vibrio fluvialis]EKO3465989.1 hypothetical protein [Vibrio fluvialis]EKO3973356.1 hypothetical protein [Vibrio fluvialis]EKO3995408.1 hypothetical protein [Vibrio fluvialis]ELV8595714.1 hypothetical protein [Vibrio fluvialis]MCE7582906.1 hypothetical protein [Vibrio fluvialis]